jgi:hypothetical protein
VVGTRISGPDIGKNAHVEQGTSRRHECVVGSVRAIAAGLQSALRRRMPTACRGDSTAARLQPKSPLKNLLQHRKSVPHPLSLARLRFEKQLPDSSFEELAKLQQCLTRSQRHTEVPRVPVGQGGPGSVAHMPASFPLAVQKLANATETTVAASRFGKARVPERSVKLSRVCFESASVTERKLGSELHAGAVGVSVTNEVRRGPALSAPRRASGSRLWQDSETCATVLARGDAQQDRARKVRLPRSSPAVREWTRPCGPTRSGESPKVGLQGVYGHASIQLRPQLCECRWGCLSALRSEPCRRAVDDRTLCYGVDSRWYRLAPSKTVETTGPVVRAEPFARLLRCETEVRPSVSVGIQESSEQAGRPLRNQSILPALGEALCVDSTPDSVARAPKIRAYSWNRSPCIRAADGYRP